MLVKSISIGGWFQRTTLHLTEVFLFLSGKELKALDKNILSKNLKSLGVISVERVSERIEFLQVNFKNNLHLKFYEDGLVLLTLEEPTSDGALIEKQMQVLKDFYENKFSPGISYVFSLGAPLPKELAKIENIYPFILNLDSDNDEEVAKIFSKQKDVAFGVLESVDKKIKIYKGKKIFAITNVADKGIVDLLSQTEIFFREFKTQMARYLHVHREIWEKINKIKTRDSIRGNEIKEVREELQEEQKTVNLIEARINQMPIYLKTRQKFSDLSEFDKNLHPLLQYKFETLLDTHDYIKSLWVMTKNYMNSANDMLGVLQTESTKSSISSLTLITTIGVVAGLVGHLSRDAFPKFTETGIYYFIGLLVVTFLINLGVQYFFKFKKYKLK